MNANIGSVEGDRRHAGGRPATTMHCSTLALIATLVLGILVGSLAAEAQLPAKVPRIGILWASIAPTGSSLLDAFRQGLHELGYVEGQNIALESRYAKGNPGLLPDLAAELAQLKVDIILTQGTAASRAAKQATSTIPIVAVAGDLVGAGLVGSLARPGENVTGVTFLGPELSAKRLELLKEAVPGLSRVAALWISVGRTRDTSSVLRETEVAAQALGLQLQILEVREASDLVSALEAATRERAEALIALPAPIRIFGSKALVDLVAKSRLPAMYDTRAFVDAGGLMAYGPSFRDMYHRAAAHVDKILKGTKPGELPVEQPMKFEFVINLKTAQALGLTLPPHLLGFADEVIR